MKNKFLNVLIIFIIFTIIMQITTIVNATDLSETEKKNIENFLKEDENLMFSSICYSNVYEIPILEDFTFSWLIAINKGTLVEYDKLSESELSEVNNITNGYKAYSFTKKDANEFLKTKIGINFSELKEYKEYENKHTITKNKETYYEITENGEAKIYNIKKIDSIEKKENGDIEVKVILYNKELNNIITLKPNGSSYLFVSNKEETKIDNKQKIQEFLNEDENLIFSYHNYSKASENPLTDEWGIPEAIVKKYGKLVEEENQEINKIVKGFKSYSFTKEDANSFLMEKMGIKFSDLNDYNAYEETHTIPSNKSVYYHIAEGYGTENIEYKVETLEILDNKNIKVKVSYNNGLINTVILKPNGNSYLFISCENNNLEYKVYNRVTTNKESKEELKEDNTTAKENIPQTGIKANIIIVLTIIVIGFIGIIMIIKYNKIKEI